MTHVPVEFTEHFGKFQVRMIPHQYQHDHGPHRRLSDRALRRNRPHGRGRDGQVYQATDTKLNLQVALGAMRS